MLSLLTPNPSINLHPRLKLGCGFLLLTLIGWPIPAAWAAESASAPAARSGDVSVHGKVAGAYDNAGFIMEDSGNFFVVSIGKELWNLGIRRGDEVAVTGSMKVGAPFQNEIKARTAKVINRPSQKEPPVRIKRSSDVREYGKVGELAVLRGQITGYHGVRMELTDAGGRILVDLDSTELREKFRSGLEVVVFGVLAGPEGVPYKRINPILIRDAADFRREDEPATAEKIEDILKARPVGKLVKAHGWAEKFIGEVQGLLLADGDARLIIRPSERYLSLDPQVGAEVEVVGVFGYETHKGKEIGTLNEARIDPMVAVSNRAALDAR